MGGKVRSPQRGVAMEQSPESTGPDEETLRRLRERARRVTYERLALVSAVIWVVGAAILFVAIVPVIPRPQRYIMVASLLPLIPAALPWLFYGKISEAVARRWATEDKYEVEA